LGAYRLSIPSTAANGDSFLIAIRNPSGVADGLMTPVPLRIPTDGSLGAGSLNTIKRVTVGSRLYLVGDATPFRWFNAGDFGDGTLNNSDVIELFQSSVMLPFVANVPPPDSDVFDAMDSSDGSSPLGVIDFGDDVSINGITAGDGGLNVDDVWVTFRRSLDPMLKWYARYWSNGVRQVVEVPNTLGSGFDARPKAVLAKAAADVPAVRPSVALSLNDALATPGASIQFPVHADLLGGYPLRVMMLSLTVEALDGSPAITVPIQFQKSPGFQVPDLTASRSPGSYAAAWLEEGVPGLPGSGTLALLNVQVPANAGPGAAYRIHFNHFSGSPNGHALFATHTSESLILLSDRSASTWGDGISDEWRLRYFGSIFSSDGAAGGDADGDGVINSIEYQNGTDPTDPLSN
jgi:hypothetical protein